MAKREPEMVREGSVMFEMLMHACPASATFLQDGSAANVFNFEAHCWEFEVTAQPLYNGQKKIIAFIVHNLSKKEC